MTANRRQALGFTLAEMLTVIAIIGILAGLVLSTLPKVEDKAKRVVCMNTLRQLGLALETYAADWHGRYPTINGARVMAQIADNPWYFALKEYGIEGRALCCPADENFDYERYPNPPELGSRLSYRSNSISYGMQYDFKDGEGNPYEASKTGGWLGKTPDGIPDILTVSDLKRKSDTIMIADSDGDGVQDYAIDATGLRRIGNRHKGAANVLFADWHVEAKPVLPEKGLDINAELRYWTLAND